MRGKKQLRKLKQLLCLLLAVILVCGAVSLESVLAVESETTQETEAQTGETVQEPEAQTEETVQEPETESVEKESESEETELAAGAETELSTNTEPDKYANRISGVLWIDANEDGTYDAGEQALADYPVYLYLEGDTDNAVQTTTTDADGEYLFEDISPGRYVVGIKAEENGTEYLLPLVGVQKDNKFYFTPDWSKVISNPIDIAADTVVEDISAAMRTMPQIQPMAATIIDMSTVSAGGSGYTYASNTVTITTNGEYEITGTTTMKRVVVANGVTADITLNGASITNSTVSPFQLNGTAIVNLTLSGTNTLTCSYSTTSSTAGYYAGLYGGLNSTLTISGTGILNATGGTWSAGIGGSRINNSNYTQSAAGTIIINSGTIIATGGDRGGAGIGGAYLGSGGNITINGGTVTAVGGYSTAVIATCGAGIGSGNNSGDGGTITINGGTITAIGGSSAATSSLGYGGAGIGGGRDGYTGNIIISGGRVTATGKGTAMDIGHGGNGVATTDTIIFTSGSILPTRGNSYVGPTPTNGSTYGAPDPVGMVTFPGYSSGDAFSIMAGGTVSSYLYEANAHPDGNVYAWLAYPGIITDPATNVTANSATLNGTYYMNGTTISSAYFEYGTSTNYGSTKTLTTPTNVTSGNIESVLDNLTGLSSNTTYHYRFVITVGSITVPGNDMTFTTLPVVDTLTAAPTGASTATISGTIVEGNASISDVVITYATDAGFTANVVTFDGSSGVTFTDTTYTANITGLTSGQTYYVKVEAVGLGGTSDAKTTSFLAGGYPVTEKFVDLSGNPVDSTGLTNNTVIVTGGYTASGIPTSHTVAGGDTYTYIGYKLDSYTTGDTLTSGTPSSVTITGNRDVYYVYAIEEGSITIEKYADNGTTPLPDAGFKLELLTGPGGTVDTSLTPLTGTTPANGEYAFTGLKKGVYRITETNAPTGYSLLKEPFEVELPYDITLPAGQTPSDTNYLYATTTGSNVTYHYYNLTYKVSDQAELGMPAAGNSGFLSQYYLWIGIGLIIAAGVTGRYRQRRRRLYQNQG